MTDLDNGDGIDTREALQDETDENVVKEPNVERQDEDVCLLERQVGH
jgi:hypothetical protein